MHAHAAGVYIFGEVGSGKSLLASMFYKLVDGQARVPLRRHMHFNIAMLEVRMAMGAPAACASATPLPAPQASMQSCALLLPAFVNAHLVAVPNCAASR